MKKNNTYFLPLLIYLFTINNSTHAYIQVSLPGLGVVERTTESPVYTPVAYDKKSGTMVIGTRTTAPNQSLISYTQNASEIVDTISLHPVIKSTGTETVEFLTTSQDENGTIRVLYTLDDAPSTIHKTTVGNTSFIPESTVTVLDYANDVFPSAGTVAMTANNTHIFVAAKGRSVDDENPGVFGDTGSSITSIAIDTMEIKNAFGIQDDVDAISGTEENSVIIIDTDLSLSQQHAALHWCEGLSRLYAGIRGGWNEQNDNNMIKVLLNFSITPNGAFYPNPVVGNHDNSDLSEGNDTSDSRIIGATNNNIESLYYSIYHLTTLKTPDNHYYLIINGGLDNADGTAAHKKVFALPLVESGSHKGALAQNHIIRDGNTLVSFETDFGTTAGDFNNLFTEEDTPAKVGGHHLPFQNDNFRVTYMEAIGDTVFCALSGIEDKNNQSGIYYSQALYNPDGTICGWTYWSQIVPGSFSGQTTNDKSCYTCAIDPIAGKIWAIPNNENNNLLKLTTWNTNSLLAQLTNKLLNGPCYSQFYLHQHVSNWASLNSNRFVFFGGDSTVIVAKTSVANDTNVLAVETYINNTAGAEGSANSFESPVNAPVSISSGLENAGPIRALGWTSQNGGTTQNYLLAGTDNGLYAYVSNDAEQNGIQIDAPQTMIDVNDIPFTTYVWKKVAAISDPVVKIVSSTSQDETYTYILTHGKTHKVWKISASNQTTLSDMNNNITLLFEGKDVSKNSTTEPTFINDIITITKDPTGLNSAVVLFTNLGIYTDIETADTVLPLEFDAQARNLISAYRPQHTLLNNNIYVTNRLYLPISQGSHNSYSGIGQINFDSSAENPLFAPTPDRIAENNDTIAFSYPIKSFYTNGAFRFFIEQKYNALKQSVLRVLPYLNGPDDYNIDYPLDLKDTALQAVRTFYWINEIAGRMMVGTDIGVISLE